MNCANEAIENNSVDCISEAIRALEKIEGIDNKYEKLNSSLKSVYYELQELSRDISSYKEDIEFDEEKQEELEQRLNLIYQLKRKYGNNIEEILSYAKEIREEIEHIENLDNYINKLKKEQKEVQEKMDKYAMEISFLRKKYSLILSGKINTVLFIKNYSFFIY